MTAFRLSAAAVAFLTVPAIAAIPSDAKERAKVIGHPSAIEVRPDSVHLDGPRAMQQLVVTGKYADGTVRDLTPFATFAPDAANIVDANAGFLRAKRNGKTQLSIQVGGLTSKVAVEVLKFDERRPVSFREDVIAGLNVGGCNAGACHGTPSGKNGFRLSLRGFDPAQDYVQLTRDVWGRRTDKEDAFASLIMQKALGRIPHEGGARFGADTIAAEMISGWISQGLPDDPKDLPAISKVEVLPGPRVLKSPARWQQLAVIAHLSNNSSRDVTRLTVFSSSDPAVAEVSPNGLVEFKQAGEVAILCRYLEQMISVRITYLEPREGFVWSNPPEANFVDKDIFAKLKLMTIQPSELCSDSEFVRRAYLDLCGLLPTSEEAVKFLADKSPNKRSKLIDSLLRTPGVRRLLGTQMVGCVALESQDDSSEGHQRVPALASREHCGEHLLRQGRPRSAHSQWQHLREPAGELLPHRQGPDQPRRDHCAVVLRHPHAMCQVPQPPVRSHGPRTTTTAWQRGLPA